MPEFRVGQSGVIAGKTGLCGTQSGTRSHVVLTWYSVLKWWVKESQAAVIQLARS
jgi:hypothetical protein